MTTVSLDVCRKYALINYVDFELEHAHWTTHTSDINEQQQKYLYLLYIFYQCYTMSIQTVVRRMVYQPYSIVV